LLAGQRFGLLQAAGAALMLVAIVGHELAHLKFKAHGVQATT
jgi:predicted metal-dependent hydrolase